MSPKRKKASALLGSLTNPTKQIERTTAGLFEAETTGRMISKVVTLGSTGVRLYAIGYLAKALDRSTATVRRWQRQGIIPPPSIATGDGARWYLKEEVEMYSRLAKQYDLQTGTSITSTGFPEAALAETEVIKTKIRKLQVAK
jgi:hypothetical protein